MSTNFLQTQSYKRRTMPQIGRCLKHLIFNSYLHISVLLNTIPIVVSNLKRTNGLLFYPNEQ